jgi:trk system potassium uptake protein TrkA
VNPEQEFGKRFANRLIYRHVVADMPLGEELQLTEIKAHPSMIGKSLMELALPKRFGVMVVAIRRGSPSRVLQPSPSEPLMEDDNLVIVSNEAAIPKLMEGI